MQCAMKMCNVQKMGLNSGKFDFLAKNGLESAKILITVPHYNFCIVQWVIVSDLEIAIASPSFASLFG